MVLCPGLCNSRSFPPLGLRAREGVGYVETDKLSDKSSDHQSRDMASPWQPGTRFLGKYPNLIFFSPSSLLSHKARKCINVIDRFRRGQPPKVQSKVQWGEGWICRGKNSRVRVMG